MGIDPRHAGLRYVGGHDGLAARHGLDLHYAKSLGLLHAAEAEHVAGTVVGRQVFIADAAQEAHFLPQPESIDFGLQLAAQLTVAANEHHEIGRQIAGGFHQVAITLIGHQAPQRKDDAAAGIASADSLDRTGNRPHGLHPDGKASRLPLHAAQERRLGKVDGRGAHHQVGAPQKPPLQRAIELKQQALLLDVAVPMEHHRALVAREVKGQAGHGVGMVDVNDVVAATNAPQSGHHRGRNHRGTSLDPSATTDKAGIIVERHHAPPAVAGGTQHVARHSTARQTGHEVVCHLLHSATYGIKLAQLQHPENFCIHKAEKLVFPETVFEFIARRKTDASSQ